MNDSRLARLLARLRPSGDGTAPTDLAWRVALVGVLAVLTVVLFPPRGSQDVPSVRAGTVASQDVIAPFDDVGVRKAAAMALKTYPIVNAQTDGDVIVYKHYVHMGVAVASDQGLVVPVIKDADTLSVDIVTKEGNALAIVYKGGYIGPILMFAVGWPLIQVLIFLPLATTRIRFHSPDR